MVGVTGSRWLHDPSISHDPSTSHDEWGVYVPSTTIVTLVVTKPQA